MMKIEYHMVDRDEGINRASTEAEWEIRIRRIEKEIGTPYATKLISYLKTLLKN